MEMTLDIVLKVGRTSTALTLAVERYPMAYTILLFSDDSLSRRAEKTLTRFNDIYDLRIDELVSRILAALQVDEDADGGLLQESDSDAEEFHD